MGHGYESRDLKSQAYVTLNNPEIRVHRNPPNENKKPFVSYLFLN